MSRALPPIAALLLTLACAPAVEEGQAQQAVAAADDVQIVTRIAGARLASVTDRAEILDGSVERALAARAAAIEAATGDQVVVVTVPSLGGLSVERFGLALGNHWGVGRAELDNGVLILVAPSERRARIEVGEGLEQVLTEPRAAEIIAKMMPAFRDGDYGAGIADGLGEIEAVLRANPERRRAA